MKEHKLVDIPIDGRSRDRVGKHFNTNPFSSNLTWYWLYGQLVGYLEISVWDKLGCQVSDQIEGKEDEDDEET